VCVCVCVCVCCMYEIGEALYIGWASGVLAICGGACLMFSCKLGSNEKTWVALRLTLTHTLQIMLSYNILFDEFVCFLHSCSGYPYQPTRETVYSTSTSRREAQSTYGRNAYV